MNTEELEAPAWKCRLQRFLEAPKYGHDIFKLYYDEDKEYYKEVLNGLLKPTEDERKDWIAKFFKICRNKEKLELDDIFSCHNCEGKFTGHAIKWKEKEKALCGRYPLCPSPWSEFDLHHEGKPVKKKEKPKNKCSKHYPKYKVADGLPKNMCPGCMEAYAFVNNMTYDEVKEKCQEEESKKYQVCYHCKQVDGENCAFCAIRRSNKE
jgi:hypothetical protein